MVSFLPAETSPFLQDLIQMPIFSPVEPPEIFSPKRNLALPVTAALIHIQGLLILGCVSFFLASL